MNLSSRTYAETLARKQARDARRRERGFKTPKRAEVGPRTTLKRGKGIKAKPDPKLQAWSKAVRERDGYTCQMTGIRDVKRNIAHHVAPRSRRPDLRLDVRNGITLTPEAHQWVHDHPIEATAQGWLSDATYEAAQKQRVA